MPKYDPRTSERIKHQGRGRTRLDPELVVLLVTAALYYAFVVAMAVFLEWWG